MFRNYLNNLIYIIFVLKNKGLRSWHAVTAKRPNPQKANMFQKA